MIFFNPNRVFIDKQKFSKAVTLKNKKGEWFFSEGKNFWKWQPVKKNGCGESNYVHDVSFLVNFIWPQENWRNRRRKTLSWTTRMKRRQRKKRTLLLSGSGWSERPLLRRKRSSLISYKRIVDAPTQRWAPRERPVYARNVRTSWNKSCPWLRRTCIATIWVSRHNSYFRNFF